MLGWTTLCLIVACGVLPMVLYTVVLWWLDCWEREPLALILVHFFLGMGPTVFLVVWIYPTALSWVTYYAIPEGTNLELYATSVVSPVLEEFIKAIGVLSLFLIFRREWNSLLDGVIYGAIIGFGFAAVENTIYFHAIARAQPNAFAAVVVWRALLFGFNHAMFASVFAWGLAYANCCSKGWSRPFVPICLFFIACFLHMAHNWLSIQGAIGTNDSLQMNAAGVLFMSFLGIYCWKKQLTCFDRTLNEEVHMGTFNQAFAKGIRQQCRVLSFAHWRLSSQSRRTWRKSRHLFGELVIAKRCSIKHPSQRTIETLEALRSQLTIASESIVDNQASVPKNSERHE